MNRHSQVCVCVLVCVLMYSPKSKGQFSVVHERGVGYVEGCRPAQGWPGQQDVRVLQQEGQVVEHGLLVLATRPAEVTEELAARYHHLMRRILRVRQAPMVTNNAVTQALHSPTV